MYLLRRSKCARRANGDLRFGGRGAEAYHRLASREATTSSASNAGAEESAFGTAARCNCVDAPFTSRDHSVSQEVQKRWVAFAREGVPAADGDVAWPADRTHRATVLEFGDATAARPGFMATRLNVFIGLLKTADFWLKRK